MNNVLMMNYYQLLALFYGGYFSLCAIPHTSAGRYILLTLSLLIGFYALYQERHNLRCRTPVFITTTAFLIVALISALISQYPDTISSFRKDYLTPGLLILVIGALPWSDLRRQQFLPVLIAGFVLGFLVKTMLAFWDGAINHPFIFSPYSNPEFFEKNGGLPVYVDFFAIDASLYLPIVFGVLLFASMNTKVRWAFSLITLLAYGIVLASGVRTAFLVATFGFFLLLLCRFAKPKHLILLTAIAAMMAAGGIQLAKTTPEADRYISLFKTQSYSKEAGMSGRYPLWIATYEIIEHRPWIGFGPGWKKLPHVAKDLGLLDLWKSDNSEYGKSKAYFYTLQQGQTNPHNLLLQLLFEIGLLGMLCYVSMLAALCLTAWKLYRVKGTRTMHSEWFIYTTPIFILCYTVLNVTNGILLPPPLTVLLISALVFVGESNNVKPD